MRLPFLLSLWLMLFAPAALTAATTGTLPAVLDRNELGVPPGDQMQASLQHEIDDAWVRWKTAYEARTDPAEITAYYAALRRKFVSALGGFPARTPLNPRVTGVLHRDGYRVEKIIFESQPGILVTAALFLPDPVRFAAPYPGVLVPSGHYPPSKAHDEYQSMGALLALNGLAALVFDPLDQGERIQSIADPAHPPYWGTEAHTRLAIQASLLGLSTARFMIWDGMRALDYLQSRPEVDPARLGCTGNSGGGTQTSYLLALDDRIKVAAPSCFIHHLSAQTRVSMGDGEQLIYGQVAFGLDHPDYLLMRAPVPIKLLAATHDFFPIEATWETYRLAQRAYTRLGASEKMAIMENDAGHNYNRAQREAAVQWLSQWLLGRTAEVHEPDLQLFTEEEMRCTAHGQVLLEPGARSIHALLTEEADRATAARNQTWANLGPDQQRAVVRQLVRIAPAGAAPTRAWTPAWTERRDGYSAEAFRVRLANGVVLPAVWLNPDHPGTEPALVYASAEGFRAGTAAGARLDSLARTGRRILAIDLRGTGETRQENQRGRSAAIGTDWQDQSRAYLLGRPYVGMQAEDLLDAAREARERTHLPQVDLMAVGEVGVAALHAAFVEPEIFRHVTLDHSLRSWDEVVRAPRFYHQFMNAVPGALQSYDLPDLAAALGNRVTVVDSTNPLGWSDKETGATAEPANLAPDRPGLTGVFFGSPNFTNPQGNDLLHSGDARWDDAQLHRGNDWAVRWRGYLTPDISGDITLSIEATETAVVRVDGREVARAEVGGKTGTGLVRIAAGQMPAIEVDFIKPGTNRPPADGIIRLNLRWKRGDSPWQTVPAAWLHHSRQQEFELEQLLR